MGCVHQLAQRLESKRKEKGHIVYSEGAIQNPVSPVLLLKAFMDMEKI